MLVFVIADGDFLLLTVDNAKLEYKEEYENAYFYPEGIAHSYYKNIHCWNNQINRNLFSYFAVHYVLQVFNAQYYYSDMILHISYIHEHLKYNHIIHVAIYKWYMYIKIEFLKTYQLKSSS